VCGYFEVTKAIRYTNKLKGDIKMINRRKRILFTFLSGIVLLMACGISSSYAQKPVHFTGTWKTTMNGKNGPNSITLTMVQKGDQVTGVYPGNGKIEGTVSGIVLRFKWQSDGGTGSGRFVMDEEDHAFNGTYNRGDNPDDVDATWSGLRLASPEWRPGDNEPPVIVYGPPGNKRQEGTPEPWGKISEAEYEKALAESEAAQKNAPAIFAGVWRTKSGEKVQFPELLLQQANNQVVGRLFASRPDLGVIKAGIVDRNTLRFQVWRPRPRTFGYNLPDDYLGIGEFVMDADGKSFKGTILGAATSGTLIAR
jgi:hypothetical protein